MAGRPKKAEEDKEIREAIYLNRHYLSGLRG